MVGKSCREPRRANEPEPRSDPPPPVQPQAHVDERRGAGAGRARAAHRDPGRGRGGLSPRPCYSRGLMKILVVNPNSSEAVNDQIMESARRASVEWVQQCVRATVRE